MEGASWDCWGGGVRVELTASLRLTRLGQANQLPSCPDLSAIPRALERRYAWCHQQQMFVPTKKQTNKQGPTPAGHRHQLVSLLFRCSSPAAIFSKQPFDFYYFFLVVTISVKPVGHSAFYQISLSPGFHLIMDSVGGLMANKTLSDGRQKSYGSHATSGRIYYYFKMRNALWKQKTKSRIITDSPQPPVFFTSSLPQLRQIKSHWNISYNLQFALILMFHVASL